MTYIKRVARVLVVALAVSVLPGAAAAQETKLDKAREIFRVMQADRMMDQMLDAVFAQMGGMMQQSHPELPREAMTIVREEVSASLRQGMPQLVEQMAGVYANVFSEEELDGMIAFYKGPIGQSLLAKMPQVMSQSVQFSQAWAMGVFQDLPQRIEQRLLEEGYEL